MSGNTVNHYHYQTIHGGTGGTGGDGGHEGGAGGPGEGPTVNFINNSDTIEAVANKLERWLGAPDMRQKQHDTEKLQMQGTGQWFLESAQFMEWQENPGVLWIEGICVGKSVLSSMVIDKLFEDRRSKSCPPAVAFFYFGFGNEDTQSVEIALHRILLQLSAYSPQPYVTLDSHYKFVEGQKLPSCQDLHNMLWTLLQALGRTYVVLDALDECDGHDFPQLVQLVLSLQAWKDTPLHLFITSQTRELFTRHFGNVSRIALEVNTTQRDIEFFVTTELNTNPELEIWKHHAEKITPQIVSKSNGMFRLAACLLTELSQEVLQGQLDVILENLPHDLFGVYDRFMLRVWERDGDHNHVKAMLCWMLFSRERLTVAQLGDAISFDFSTPEYGYKPDRRENSVAAISRWSAGLISFNSDSVTLAHGSVRDYLLSKHFKGKFTDLSDDLSHALLFRTCMNYLLYFRDQELNKKTLESYPLASYASTQWYHHILHSNDRKGLLPLERLVLTSRVMHKFPTVDFHTVSQRLAVATAGGAIVMYDLKTMNRLYILEGHMKGITVCTFSTDGRRLVTLSLEESVVMVWKVGASFWSFFNPAAPQQGHDGPGPFKTMTFDMGDEGKMTAAESLDLVRVEWIADRAMRLQIRESRWTFST
ncbi:hypothetical protein B0H16DRAFT_1719365 [Mycena metata]|uniref:Nephrocystin 3-like N-terminal domain-containing protein n=1 Tax=Mycena metata TaxID=1033252 RepID=A0AAD7JE44_9AGAR|nr:hypothetical protein B0H16DRAFT_1719365 [Mycena metata]